MRIAILTPLFPPKWLAGTEIATYNIAKHLARRGHEVHIITSLDEELPKKSCEEGFCIHRVKVVNKPKLFYFTFSLSTFSAIKRINPDIVHIQAISTSLLAPLVKKILKKSYVVYCRGSDVYRPWPFKNIFSKFILNSASLGIVLTKDMKKRMQAICDTEISVIPNGIDLERFRGLIRKKFRKKLKVGEDEKIIIFVGALRPVKGVRYLIEAMKVITDENRSTKLFLVGDGKERESLESLVEKLGLENHVNFIGKVPNERVPEYMIASDVFVLPSLSEGFPVTVLEAMASGLPIITTNVGGLSEIIKKNENGFLVKPKNVKELSAKISLLLKNDKLRKKIGENNKHAVHKYSWENLVCMIEKVYFNILS